MLHPELDSHDSSEFVTETVTGRRKDMLWTAVELFRAMDYFDIKARLSSYEPPPILEGTLQNHRPDLTARQPSSGRTPTIVDVVDPRLLLYGADRDLENRYSLLQSAAKLYKAELHFVLPTHDHPFSQRTTFERMLKQFGVTKYWIWEI